MGHNPSRYAAKRIQLQALLQAGDHKARSVWGRWWQLDGDFKARLFSQDEIRWIRRYGARLDELANLALAPRNEKEEHFVKVAAHGGQPNTERERLWLRVQMACRFEDSIEKAALCMQALDAAAGLDAEARQLRIDMRDAEDQVAELLEALALAGGDPAAKRRRSLSNVVSATMLFPRMGEREGPERFIFDIARQHVPSQLLPPSRAGIGH